MMQAFLPPSSRLTCLSRSAPAFIIARPVGTLPMREMRGTRGGATAPPVGPRTRRVHAPLAHGDGFALRFGHQPGIELDLDRSDDGVFKHFADRIAAVCAADCRRLRGVGA